MIRQKDGIHIQQNGKIVLDGRNSAGDINFMSHAHADHSLNKNSRNIVCSDLTASLARKRFDSPEESSSKHERIEQIPSGHILGSTAALIDGEILYTGDVSLQDRFYLDGFRPPKA